jgi:heme exporter protein A
MSHAQPDFPVGQQLSAQSLSSQRDDWPLFAPVDFQLSSGEALQIQGPNGAGKTTLLRILCGLRLPTTGQVLWNGKATRLQGHHWASVLHFIGHHGAIKPDLDVQENLRFTARLLGGSTRHLNAVLDKLQLAHLDTRLGRQLSAGQQRRLALARLLLSPRPVWILDEPYTALDAEGIACTNDLILSHLKARGLLVMTSHQPVALPSTHLRQLTLEPLPCPC